MSGEIRFKTTKSLIKGQILDASGQMWDGSSMVPESNLSSAEWMSALITLVQGATTDPSNTGLWLADWPGSLTPLAIYDVILYSGAAPAPGDQHIGIQSDPTEYGIERVADVYYADIDIVIDEDNSLDEYSIRWRKNDVQVTSGITFPKIQVINRADGSDLIALTDMVQIGTTGGYKYDEATNRITAGEGVEVVVTSTIDGASRPWSRFASRDSFG